MKLGLTPEINMSELSRAERLCDVDIDTLEMISFAGQC